MVDADFPFRNSFGSFYPTHSIVALVDEEANADHILSDLEAAGSDQNEMASPAGEAMLQNYETQQAKRNLGQRIAGAFPSEEQAATQGYLEAARRGARAVVVHVPDSSRQDQVRKILRNHGEYSMRYFGDHTITDLS